jgi:hypothetical protein
MQSSKFFKSFLEPLKRYDGLQWRFKIADVPHNEDLNGPFSPQRLFAQKIRCNFESALWVLEGVF